MLAFLSHLLGHTDKPLGTAVHIGAGVGRELELYNALNFSQVVAVEPDPTLFNKLNRKAKRYNHVQVKDLWIASQSGDTPIHCFANPRFNSLLAPDQLSEHFSNLDTSEQKTANAQGINDFIATLQPLNPKQCHLLVLDVQGAEAMLLSACSPEYLNQFEWVVVRTSQHSLYKESLTATELVGSLTKRDFTLRFSDDENEPFTEHFYQRDQNAIKIKQTEKKLQESQQGNKELSTRCENAEQALEQVNSAKSELTAKLDEQAKLCIAKDKELADKSGEVETLKQQLASLTQAQQQRVTDSEQKVKTAQQELANKQADVDKANQRIAELTKQLEQKALDVTNLEAEKQKAQETQQRLENEKKELSQSLESHKKLVQELQEKTKQAEDITKQLREEKQGLAEQLEKHKQTTQEHLEKVKQAEDTAKQLREEKQGLVEQLEKQEQASQEQLERINSFESSVNELQNELESSKKELGEQTHWHNENKNWAESLNQDVSQLKQQLAERQQTSDMVVKLHAKALNDLDDLRKKYQVKHYNEKKLVELVKELRVKLQQAAEFYHYLEEHHPELADNENAVSNSKNIKISKPRKSTKKS